MKQLFLLLGTLFLAPALGTSLTTLSERSGWKKTGRYDEVLRLCSAFADAYPLQVRCLTFGKTPEARPMVALVVTDEGRDIRSRPVILFQGGIHGGEIDGKDAGFLFLRELLAGELLTGALAKVTLVFVPVFNVDGSERFGAHNRPNQVGPEEMGWRTTAQNLNLNRDYTKVDAPEMAAMLRLLQEWDPIVYADLHVTDGAQFQPDVSINVHPSDAGPLPLRGVGEEIRKGILEKLEAKGHRPLPFYPTFRKNDEPRSGFEANVAPPRFSHGYWQWHNRVGILVETHSWKDYATRVRVTHDTLVALTELAMRDGKQWLEAAAKADREASRLSGGKVALSYEPSKRSIPLSFPGYAYRRDSSSISGGPRIVYDPSRPEIWKIPFFSELLPGLELPAPREGYLVPAAYAGWVAEKLRLHGVSYENWTKPRGTLAVETFRARETNFAKESFEGHARLTVTGSWATEKREIPVGSLFVPIAQPASRLVMQLFEPRAVDSFLAWGFFNAAFEQKEYMEDYVAEAVAREMLAKSPELKKEFERRLREDADFASSPQKRLEFFYRRHSSWDERYQLYPVYRLNLR